MKKKEEEKEEIYQPNISKQNDFNNEMFDNLLIERRDKVDQGNSGYNGISFHNQSYSGYNKDQFERPYESNKGETDFRMKNCDYPYQNGSYMYDPQKFINDSKDMLFNSKQTKRNNQSRFEDPFEYDDQNYYEPSKGKKRGRKRKNRPLEQL